MTSRPMTESEKRGFLGDDHEEDPGYTVDGFVRDEGTVGVFSTVEGPHIAVDHRAAVDLLILLDEHGTVPVHVEDWQVLG